MKSRACAFQTTTYGCCCREAIKVKIPNASGKTKTKYGYGSIDEVVRWRHRIIATYKGKNLNNDQFLSKYHFKKSHYTDHGKNIFLYPYIITPSSSKQSSDDNRFSRLVKKTLRTIISVDSMIAVCQGLINDTNMN
eukprot:Awhi_evm1s3237